MDWIKIMEDTPFLRIKSAGGGVLCVWIGDLGITPGSFGKKKSRQIPLCLCPTDKNGG